MDDKQKSAIRLDHWIEHNREHMKGYAEVADVLENVGEQDAARNIRRAMELMAEANDEFGKALDDLKSKIEPVDRTSHGHDHDHHHH